MKQLALTINGTPMDKPTGLPDSGGTSLQTIVGNGLTIIMVFAAFFALFILIRGGIQWTMSGGEKGKIEQARMRIIYGILGLLLVFFSFFIMNFVLGLFNLT